MSRKMRRKREKTIAKAIQRSIPGSRRAPLGRRMRSVRDQITKAQNQDRPQPTPQVPTRMTPWRFIRKWYRRIRASLYQRYDRWRTRG